MKDDSVFRAAVAWTKTYGKPLSGVTHHVVTVHPLGDEAHLLKALKMRPEECRSCDMYWAKSDGVFLVCISSASLAQKTPRTSFRKHDDFGPPEYQGNYYVVVEDEVITTAVVQRVLDGLVKEKS